MQYHNITKDDMLNGDGLRVVLWVAGCGHACPGCHNPITWDENGGLPFDEAAKEEIFTELAKDYVSGVTFRAAIRSIRQTVSRSVRSPAKSMRVFRKRPSGCIQATAGSRSQICRSLMP